MPIAIHRLAAGRTEVEVLPDMGARLHRLRVDGVDVLRTPDDPREHEHDPFFWGAYNMAPWCNRIDAGPVRVGKQTVDLASNFRDGSAIHGQVYDRPWQTEEPGSYLVRGGGNGWPWPYEVGMLVGIEEHVVRVTQVVRNMADDPMPAGIGLHPWFDGQPRIAIHGSLVYPTNMGSPAQPHAVEGDLDLRETGVMTRGLDGTWTDIADPAVELAWSAIGMGAMMRSDTPSLHVTAASPTEFDAIAIEPQTHAPQGLRRLLNKEPGALTWLAPGAELKQVIEIRFETNGG